MAGIDADPDAYSLSDQDWEKVKPLVRICRPKADQRLAVEIQDAIDDPRPSVPHDEVMARMDARMVEILRLKRTV